MGGRSRTGAGARRSGVIEMDVGEEDVPKIAQRAAVASKACLECRKAQGGPALDQDRAFRGSDEKGADEFPDPLETEIDGGDELGVDVGSSLVHGARCGVRGT